MAGSYTLIRASSGSYAKVMPDLGFNCFSFMAATSGGLCETLWSDAQLSHESSPDASGIPILFPFGGRLNGNAYSWDGQTWVVSDGFGYGETVMHGFVLNRPWRVMAQSTDSITGEFQASVDAPELLDQWPSDFLIRIRYQIVASSLITDVDIENPGSAPLPYGFATHGYYMLDLGGGDSQSAELTIPAAATWELVDMLPTGQIIPVTPGMDFREGSPIGDRRLDTIYTDLTYLGADTTGAIIRDPGAGRSLHVQATGPFREFVVYTPQGVPAIAIEPYTCTPTMFELNELGIDAGIRVLDPGASESMSIEIRLDED